MRQRRTRPRRTVRIGLSLRKSVERNATHIASLRPGTRAWLLLPLSIILAVSICAAAAVADGLQAESPFIDETATLHAIESGPTIEAPDTTNPTAALAMPHSDLERDEAVELLDAVFQPQLQGSTTPIDETEVVKFLSSNVAVVREDRSAGSSSGNVLLDSTLPLRSTVGTGDSEVIDLGLEATEGRLEPANPLVEVGIPDHLGEGIELPEANVQIELTGAPGDRAPTTTDESVAVYPNVAENTDFAVTPVPTGVETLTQLRAPDAPRSETFSVSLPPGSVLEPTDDGGAVVRSGEEASVGILPPTGIDAQGNPVAVQLEVNGSSFTITADPGAEAAYPILIDPLIQSYEWRAKKSGAGIYNDTGHEEWSPEQVHKKGFSTAPYMSNHVFITWLPLEAGDSGLLVSGGEEWTAGDHANWIYTVPRYFTDKSKPTSFISHLTLTNLVWTATSEFLSPYVFAGIWDPTKAAWVSSYSHESLAGHSVKDMTYQYQFPNENAQHEPNTDAKMASVGEYATETHTRGDGEIYVGNATVELGDREAPSGPTASGPAGWLNQASAPITFTASDSGLGVFALNAATEQLNAEGKPLHSWRAAYGCTGVAESACPRTWNSSEAGHPALSVEPPMLPSGIDYVNVSAEDPVGNKSASSFVQLKVDHTAPTISAFAGTATETGTLGFKRPSYTIEVPVSDGTSSAPQAGLGEAKLTIDGTKVLDSYAGGCSTENCKYTLKGTIKASEYTLGNHKIEVTAKDAVGNIATPKEFSLYLSPTAPTVALAGTITEQATLGKERPSYKLRYTASEGAGPASPPLPGLVAAYSFDENSGTIAHDSSGNHNATQIKGATWTSGKFGSALKFNAAKKDEVIIPDSEDLRLGNFTLEAEVSPEETREWAPVIAKVESGGPGYALFGGGEVSGHPEGFLSEGNWVHGYVYDPQPIPLNSWSDIAVTSDGSKLRLYVNGVQVGEHAATGIVAGKGPLTIGGAEPFAEGEHYDGKIDEVRVYSRALSEAELKTDRSNAIQSPAARRYPLAAYAFNNESAANAYDYTGHGHEGVISKAKVATGKIGGALEFKASEHALVKVPDSPEFHSEAFTATTWVYPTESRTGAPLITKGGSGKGYGFQLLAGGAGAGKPKARITNGITNLANVESTAALPLNTWSYVTATYDGKVLRLLVNGEQKATTAAPEVELGIGELQLGGTEAFGAAEYLSGKEDDAQLFNRALTTEEINAEKTSIYGVLYPGYGNTMPGIASTEVKIDSKVIDQSNASCQSENCFVTREVKINPGEFAAGAHFLTVTATDLLGNVTSKARIIEFAKDTVSPTLETGGSLIKAPAGWVEQEGYGVASTAKDAGAGVTALRLKIDGKEIAGTVGGCPGGGCELSLQKTIDMGPYAGGAHPAELIATDGVGNTKSYKWNINVDPDGVITTSETVDTIEALEETSPVNVLGEPKAEEAIEGTAPGLGVTPTPGGYEATGTEVPTTVSRDPKEGSEFEIPEAELFGPCVDPDAEPRELTPAEEAEKERQIDNGQLDPVDTCTPPPLPSGQPLLTPISVAPKTMGGSATESTIAQGTAIVTANTAAETDAIDRPLYEGLITFQDIRSASAPRAYSWTVALEANQHLSLIDGEHAEVYYANGHPAFGIAAEPAHDAVGASVPTSLSVSGNIVTLNVNLSNGVIVYPVLAGAGWQGGFISGVVQGPKDEQELREERERIEREEREEREQEENGGGGGGGHVSRRGMQRIARVQAMSAPDASISSTDNGQVPSTAGHRFVFSECRETIDGDQTPIDPEGRDGVHGEIVGNCIKDVQTDLLSSFVVRGIVHVRPHARVWVDQGRPGNLECATSGSQRGAKVNCFAKPWRTASGLTVRGDFRFQLPYVISAECITIYGHLNSFAPVIEAEESLITTVGAGDFFEKCNWPAPPG
jgi:hypothetical protein